MKRLIGFWVVATAAIAVHEAAAQWMVMSGTAGALLSLGGDGYVALGCTLAFVGGRVLGSFVLAGLVGGSAFVILRRLATWWSDDAATASTKPRSRASLHPGAGHDSGERQPR